MIQLLKTISRVSAEQAGEDPTFWLTFYEDGYQRGQIEFGAEAAETLASALRNAGIQVIDLTAQQEEEVPEDV